MPRAIAAATPSAGIRRRARAHPSGRRPRARTFVRDRVSLESLAPSRNPRPGRRGLSRSTPAPRASGHRERNAAMLSLALGSRRAALIGLVALAALIARHTPALAAE